MARPTKLTAAVEKAILDALRAGATRTAAFEAAGVSRERIRIWMSRFVAFRDAILVAEAQAEIRATIAIRTAINENDWRASFAWLERRRHAEWGKVDRVELSIRLAAERVAAETGADPDWLVKRAAEIAARAQSAEASS